MATDKIQAIGRIPALAGLPRALMLQLSEVSGLQRIDQGSMLFREGERCHFVYGFVSGAVALVTEGSSAEIIADFMHAGELVLVPPAILDLPYMVSGRATTDILALLVPAPAFRDAVNTNVELAAAVARTLATHWRLLLNQMKKLKTGDADTRLAQYLLDNISMGKTRFTLPGSKRQLAAHLGMTPETLSRALKRLSEFGVATNGSEVTVSSIPLLATLTGRSDRGSVSSLSNGDDR